MLSEPPQRLRHRRGKGRRYVADVVERVRELVVGTTWPEAAIAARVGVGVATVHGWKTRRRWERPPGTSFSTRKVGVDRAGFTRRRREVLRRVESAAVSEILRLCASGEDRPSLVRAVAIIVRTRAVLRPGCSRTAWKRLRELATREVERHGGSGDGEGGRPFRAVADHARQALYRIPCRPREEEP